MEGSFVNNSLDQKPVMVQAGIGQENLVCGGLIDRNQPTRDVRAQVLQSHAVEVRLAEDLSGARFLWQPNMYDMILLDVRRHLPGEALEFYEQIRARKP